MNRLAMSSATLLGALLGACVDQREPMAPAAPAAQIVDAVHSGGNQHFYWLPPLVPEPTPTGVFDPSLSPSVEICEWTGSSCVLPLLARFTMSSGSGSEVVRLGLEGEHYIVNWHTRRFGLDPAKTYRMSVFAQGVELGKADVDVVRSGRELKDVDTDQFIPLLNGRTLPIKFRVEEGALPPVTRWIQLLPAGAIPAIRGGHTAVLDEGSNRLIVFGGRAAGSLVSEVWVLTNANGLGGTPTWMPLAPTGSSPPGRIGHSAIYDPGSNRMIVFAGTTDATRLNDVWVLTNANGTEAVAPIWVPLAPGGPLPAVRAGHSYTYDPISNRMTVFGGEAQYGNPNGLSDLWILTNANGLGGAPVWTEQAPDGVGPSARGEGTAWYDGLNNRMIMYSGSPNACGLDEIWVLENANGLGGTPSWSQLPTFGTSPEVRIGPNIGYRPASNRLVLFAGFGGIPCFPSFQDVWILTNANGLGGSSTWIELAPTGGPPPPRVAYVSDAYDETTNRLIVFGGQTGANPTGSTEFLNDVWVLVNADGSP